MSRNPDQTVQKNTTYTANYIIGRFYPTLS